MPEDDPDFIAKILSDLKWAKRFRSYAALMLTFGPFVVWAALSYLNEKNDARYTKRDEHLTMSATVEKHSESIGALKERQAVMSEKIDGVQRSLENGQAAILNEIRGLRAK